MANKTISPLVKTVQKYCYLLDPEKTSRPEAGGLVKMKSGLPRFSLSSEDKAIDLRVIATGIE